MLELPDTRTLGIYGLRPGSLLLTHYEVQHIQKNILEFKRRNMELLMSETNPEVLRAMELFTDFGDLQINVASMPRHLYISFAGNISGARQLPGAALFCFPLIPKDVTKGSEKVPWLQDVHAKYKNALVEIAGLFQLSRNILIAVLPLSAHAIKSTASEFLLDWLLQYEHEHRQWSAAISLGLISSCLHVTDHKQKFLNIKALLEAPRFPALDWGTIIRRCMKYEDQVAELLPSELPLKRGMLREECLQLSLAHASQFNHLLSFLDELSDLSRFKTLELNLQSWILCHLAELIKIFLVSRLENLFDDVAKFLSSLDSDGVRNIDQKSLCGFRAGWVFTFEVLFSSLPLLQSIACQGMEEAYSVEV
ncbi:ARM repeat superfamily protein [Actinidia rufa]|uniref:ARM repeat superfamily protein n=1 Tax=Actinidia rufa TaxID=165716 RepID=A0A7J0H145_9ERIC|nr:ARM repeat superfamily protein [Actinidia rufa]